MLKITGGEFKGKGLKTVSKTEIRPTPAKVREAIFNILRDKLSGKLFLDLFAGSGIVGIEALSRGAAHAFFFEKDRAHFKLLSQNIEKMGLGSKATIRHEDAFSIRRAPVPCDIVFADPPYGSGLLEKILPLLGGNGMIKPQGIVIAEHFKKTILAPAYGNLERYGEYSYGDTLLTFYHTRPDAA